LKLVNDLNFTSDSILGEEVKKIFYQGKYYICLHDLNYLFKIPDSNSSVRDHCVSTGTIKVIAPLKNKKTVKEQVFIDLNNLFLIISSGTLKKRMNEETVFMVISSLVSYSIPLKIEEASLSLDFLNSLGYSKNDVSKTVCSSGLIPPDEILQNISLKSFEQSGYDVVYSISYYFKYKIVIKNFSFMDEELLFQYSLKLKEKEKLNQKISFRYKDGKIEYNEYFYNLLIDDIKMNSLSISNLENGRYISIIDKILEVKINEKVHS
jgi:hypothetical protein